MKTKILVLLSVLFLLITAQAYSYDAAIEDGLTWLQSSQNAEGSWGNTDPSVTSEYFSTVSVLETIKELGRDNTPSYQSGILWLQTQTINDTGYAALRIKTLPATGTVTGTVRDSSINADPVEGATITLTGVFSGSAVTDINGRFLFTDVPPGSYTMTLSMTAYDSVTGTVTVEAGGVLSASLILGAYTQLQGGIDNISDISALLSYKNTDNGWGGYLNYTSNNFHTSMAIQALKALNSSDQATMNSAITYLVTSQNTDGGWGLITGDESNVYMTAIVSMTLQQFSQTTSISTAINKATAYLTAHQNTDGGFGASISAGSTVYETSLAYIALVGVITDNTVLGNAINYLTLTKDADGSWLQDPFSTALALKALYLSENILTPPPSSPTTGTITGKIVDASSNQPLGGVTVISGQLSATTTNTGEFTLSGIPSGSQTINFSLTGYAATSIIVNITAGSIVNPGTIFLSANPTTGIIKGTVTDTVTNQPVEGAAITVTGAFSGSTLTSIDGSFIFTDVTPGGVTIEASKTGYYSVTGTGTVAAGGTLFFSPKLSTTPPQPQQSTGTVTGTVVDAATNEPIAGATVSIGSFSGSADAQGVFLMQDITPGTYQLTIFASGYMSQSYQLMMFAGNTTNMQTIYLMPVFQTTTITGTVTDIATGSPVAGADVVVVGTSLYTKTDAAGTYAINGITLLDFNIKASLAGYDSRTYSISTTDYVTYTVDFALNQSQASDLRITSLTTDKQSYSVNEDVLIMAVVENSGNASAQGHVLAEIQDTGGNVIAIVSPAESDITLAPSANIQTTTQWNTGQFPAGDYNIILKVTDPSTIGYGNPIGTLLVERYMPINIAPASAIGGSIALTPPVTQANMQTPIVITAAIRNTGNVGITTTMRLEAVLNGAVVYTKDEPITALQINNIQSFAFGSFTPQEGGNYTVTLMPVDSAITSNISTTLYVGPYATATFTAIPDRAIIGNAKVTGKITLTGISSASGIVQDPIVPLIKDAMQKGVKWGQEQSINWQQSYQKCYGCHVQTQSLIGFELSRDKVTVDDARTSQLLNYMKSCQTLSGMMTRYPGGTSDSQPLEATTLYAWSLTYYHDTTQIQNSLATAVNYLITRQNASGYWVSDYYYGSNDWWSDLGQNQPSTPFTAYNIISMVKAYQLTGQQTYKDSLLKAVNYLITLDHTRSIITAANIATGLQSALPVIDDAALETSIEVKVETVIGYIRSNQNTDSGWGRYAGNTSDPIPTANVLYAMSLSGIQGTDPALRNGVTYLLNKQNADGTWTTTFIRANTYPDKYFAATTWAIISLPAALETIAGVDASLMVAIPQNITINNSSITPASITPTQNGADYLWDFVGLTDSGKELFMDMTLSGLQLGEEREIASEAYLSFEDTYTSTIKNIPLDIPAVSGISPVAIGAATDKGVYSANEDEVITTTVSNISAAIKSPTVKLSIEDTDGNIVNEIPEFQVSSLNPPYESPFLYGWNNRVKLAIDHTKIESDLSDFPMRIHLGGSSGINKQDVTQMFNELSASSTNTGKLYVANSNSDYPKIYSSYMVPANSDCTVQLDFEGMSMDSSDGGSSDGIGLRITDSNNSNTYVELKIRPLSGNGFSVYNYTNGSVTSTGHYTRYSTYGSIKIERTGTTHKFYVKDGDGSWQLKYTRTKTSNEAKIEIVTNRNLDYYIDNFSLISGSNFVGKSFNTFTDTFDNYQNNGDPLDSSSWQIDGSLDICRVELTATASNRKKIAVATEDGQQCYVEIERWDDIGKEADLWVKVPSISSLEDKTLYLYYDATQSDNVSYVGETGSDPARNVWDSHYKAVYHLEEKTGNAADSTSRNNHGTAYNFLETNRAVQSPLSNSYHFTGTEYINLPDNSDFKPDYVSIEAMVNVDAGNPNWSRIFDRYYYPYNGYTLAVSDTGTVNIHARLTGSEEIVAKTTSIVEGDGQWHWITGTYEAGIAKMFNNGTLETVSAPTTDKVIIHLSSETPRIGDGVYDPNFKGYITELRISDIARSDAWVKASNSAIYDNLINFGSFESAGAVDPLSINVYNITWNTGATYPGDYIVRAKLYESGVFIAEDTTAFTILPDTALSSSVTVDKITYNPNETAAVTSTIQSASANYIFENLTANMTLTNSQGAVLYTETNPIMMLMQGQAEEFNSYWNTGTNPPGNYSVALEVTDSAGSVLSVSTGSFTISGDIKPSVQLRGQISVDKQVLLRGDPLAINYSVTNVGNIDLSQIDLSILTVHAVQLTTYDTLTDHATLQMGQSYTGTQPLGTQNYSAKDYLVILRAGISGVEETLASAYFRVEGAPSAPSLSLPANGVDIETLTPALEVNNSSDPNDDKPTYEFELYTDSGLSNLLIFSGAIVEGSNTTAWQLPIELQENAVYYWRARAYDGILYGDWMPSAQFRVNLVNDLPTLPTLSGPADNSEVDTLIPVLTVNNASDPDSSNLTYNFELASDIDFTQIVASATGIFEGNGTTSWQAPVNLAENSWYYWRAQADDWLVEGPWMTTAKFFVNTANDAPSAPAVISPADNAEVTVAAVDIVISNSTDPDSAALTYIFEADTVTTFDSLNIIRSGSIPEGTGTTTWNTGGLSDNTYYYVRVKSSDGLAESPWSVVAGFFVNTVNDAPTTPVQSNPSDGGAVNVFNPALSVYNSSDIDRDVLTYEFEIYADAAMTGLVTAEADIPESPQITSWTVPVSLMENVTYYWRARTFDGELNSSWTPLTSFMVNTANDAPGAPALKSPSDGSSLAVLTPTLSVYNAIDPDSDYLTYDFEIYSGGVLIRSITGIPQNAGGITSAVLSTALSDNTTYNWRARAYDGDRYGAWMNMAAFSIHLPVTNITATIEFEPETLNKKSNGKWVTVEIELPNGYSVTNINISSIRLNGIVPAEAWPYSIKRKDDDDEDEDELKVKFNRNAVINLLPNGDNVPVTVTGTVGTTTFEGVDRIRVIK